MKKILLLLIVLLPTIASAQMRCYQFGMHGTFPDWRDTSCIACTGDLALMSVIQTQLALPVAQRDKHISGNIAGGDAGVNHNGSHNFLWHFIPGEWGLADLSAELCDGRPYTDVDLDTNYWIHTVQYFCPWSSYVQKEIATTSIGGPGPDDIQLAVYPNPVVQYVTITGNKPVNSLLILTDVCGRVVHSLPLDLRAGIPFTTDLGHLPAGAYFLRLEQEHTVFTGRLVKM